MIKPWPEYKGLNITLNITEDCNCACLYCYEVDKKPSDLPLEYAERFIDLILKEKDPIGVIGTEYEWILNQGLVIDLIGGDALMKPDLCDKILQHFIFKSNTINHKWANRWRCSISSNGCCFDISGVKDFLDKYKRNISLGVSIDGCPEIHDKNRIRKDGSGSMKAILKNWDWYLQYAGESASTKATLNKDSIPYLYRSVKFLHEEMKLQYINMNFIMEKMDITKNDLDELEFQMQLIVDYVLHHRNDLYLSLLDQEMAIGNPMNEDTKNRGICGSGCMPALGINGKIYPCFRFLPHTMSDRNFDFNVGDIWSGFNHKERFGEIRGCTRLKISEEKCKECKDESACPWCIGGAYSENGRFFRPTYICELSKIKSKYAKLYWEKYNIYEATK